MKTLALSLFLLAFAPLQAKAFVPVSEQTDLLSYVAMPLAVSSVCDVRGVQTDRVGNLVTYMDQANVPPEAFVDVFRYVPVALVMRTDRRPDFVEWVHGEVTQGVNGPALVTAMEQQLGTYGSGITVVSSRPLRHRRHHYSRDYAYADYPYDQYAYRDAFADEYVPVVVRHYCEREFDEPLALIDMPVAVSDVYGLGLPVQRVSSLAIELNIGGVPPVQFVELMRYAPAALVVDTGYAPDFVTYVHTQEVGGVYGLPLVQAIDQQFPVYGVNAQLDLTSPGYYYSPNNYYVPNYAPTAPQYQAQYYVPPVDPAYVPPVVQTRVASGFAAGGANYALPQQTAPAIAAAPQVQRLLNAPNGGAVVTSPAQARREIAKQARAARQAPISAPAFAQAQAPQVMAQQHGGAAFNRGHNIAARPPLPAHASPTAQMMRGVGHGRHVGTSGIAPAMAAAPVHGNGHGRGRAVAAAPSFVRPAAPQMIQHGNGNGHGRGHQQAAPVMAAPQPQMIQHGNGNGHGRGHQQAMPMMAAPQPAAPAPQMIQHGNGHGHGGPPMAVAPAPGPAPMVAPPHGGGGGHVPPGQEKKGKGH
ncbi:MAG TPA: hypothetical protein VGR95_08490 [Thermoanaerobaculia bacterium]|jgi:hypothetical protein|nr:hypothetical protein [Thermoanaerobaculia bacterium]